MGRVPGRCGSCCEASPKPADLKVKGLNPLVMLGAGCAAVAAGAIGLQAEWEAEGAG